MNAKESGTHIHSEARGSNWKPWPAGTLVLPGMRAGAKEMILGGKNKIKSFAALSKRREREKPFLLKQNKLPNCWKKGLVPRSARASRTDWGNGRIPYLYFTKMGFEIPNRV